MGADPPAGSRSRAHGHRVRGRSILKLKDFLALTQPDELVNLSVFAEQENLLDVWGHGRLPQLHSGDLLIVFVKT